MQSDAWLRLTDYASKYRVSISTLRRRIKGGHLSHRFEDGKYLVLDVPPCEPEVSLPDMRAEAVSAVPILAETNERLNQLHESTNQNLSQSSDEPILSSANRLLSELKRAYMNILHEKEEQIIQLKEEVTDLKTLVRVLEDENARLNRRNQSYNS